MKKQTYLIIIIAAAGALWFFFRRGVTPQATSARNPVTPGNPLNNVSGATVFRPAPVTRAGAGGAPGSGSGQAGATVDLTPAFKAVGGLIGRGFDWLFTPSEPKPFESPAPAGTGYDPFNNTSTAPAPVVEIPDGTGNDPFNNTSTSVSWGSPLSLPSLAPKPRPVRAHLGTGRADR